MATEENSTSVLIDYLGVEITYDFTGPESNRLLFWVFKVCCTAIAVAHTEGVNDRFAAGAVTRFAAPPVSFHCIEIFSFE